MTPQPITGVNSAIITADKALPLYFHVANDLAKIKSDKFYLPALHRTLNSPKTSPPLESRQALLNTIGMHYEPGEQLCFTSSWIYLLAYSQIHSKGREDINVHILIALGPRLVVNFTHIVRQADFLRETSLEAEGHHLIHLGRFYGNHPKMSVTATEQAELRKMADIRQEYRATGRMNAQAIAIDTPAKRITHDPQDFLRAINFVVGSVSGTGTDEIWFEIVHRVAQYCIDFCARTTVNVLDPLVADLCGGAENFKALTPEAKLAHGMLLNFVHCWHANMQAINKLNLTLQEKTQMALEFSIPGGKNCRRYVAPGRM